MLNRLRSIPFEYSIITDYLLMGTTPKLKDYRELRQLGVKLAINMRIEHVALSKAIPTVWIPSLDTKFTPIMPKRLKTALSQSQQVISSGGKIIVYCRAGRHRSLVMAAAILITQGFSAKDAIALIKSKRLVADPETEHIQKAILIFEKWYLNESK